MNTERLHRLAFSPPNNSRPFADKASFESTQLANVRRPHYSRTGRRPPPRRQSSGGNTNAQPAARQENPPTAPKLGPGKEWGRKWAGKKSGPGHKQP